MAGDNPKICVALVNDDLSVLERVGTFADFYEIRIDLIGENWQQVAKTLNKPWIATNRRREEGGKWNGSEQARLATLISALDFQPTLIDVELQTPALPDFVLEVRKRAGIMISSHNLESTPTLDEMRYMIQRMKDVGADVCKLVTTARGFPDNIKVLQIIHEFKQEKIICFAMGEEGRLSRVLAPLAGAYFTFAASDVGHESAPGQVTAAALHYLYEMIIHGR